METFEQIALRICTEYQQKRQFTGWITVDGRSDIEMIWLVIDAITKELDRRNETTHQTS
jgi:hypothetical protein